MHVQPACVLVCLCGLCGVLETVLCECRLCVYVPMAKELEQEAAALRTVKAESIAALGQDTEAGCSTLRAELQVRCQLGAFRFRLVDVLMQVVFHVCAACSSLTVVTCNV